MSHRYEGKFVHTPTPTQPKEVKKIPLRHRIIHFKRVVRRNRFYRWGLCILTCVIMFNCGRLHQHFVDKDKYAVITEAKVSEVSAEYEAAIVDINKAHEEDILTVRAEYEATAPNTIMQKEAEYIAKVLYGTALNHDERYQRTLVWCILNRVDSAGYPSSVKEVCEQDSQWIGYDSDSPILNELYEIALKELETWHNNYRPVNKSYVFMSWSSTEISLRDTYEKTNNTRYWQAG